MKEPLSQSLVVAFGSNLGDRLGHFCLAVHLPPKEVLSIFQSVEEGTGRERGFPNAPRTLDLDLLFFKGRIVRERGICVPHPRWKERSFVVRPLVEISPHLRDPETG